MKKDKEVQFETPIRYTEKRSRQGPRQQAFDNLHDKIRAHGLKHAVMPSHRSLPR